MRTVAELATTSGIRPRLLRYVMDHSGEFVGCPTIRGLGRGLPRQILTDAQAAWVLAAASLMLAGLRREVAMPEAKKAVAAWPAGTHEVAVGPVRVLLDLARLIDGSRLVVDAAAGVDCTPQDASPRKRSST
jgi:hypothetical protein